MKLSPIQESNTRFLRIALISSNAVMRMGLHMLLKTHPFASEVDDVLLGANAVEIIVRKKPQVIIVDLELADADTTELIRKLRAAAQDSYILVLSGLDDAKLTREALAAGAEGVVLTIQPPAVLFAAIESVCGLAPRRVDNQPAQSAIGQSGGRSSVRVNDRTRAGLNGSLTSRELEIVHSLARGFKNKQIADRLSIKEATVRRHFTVIFSKMQVSSRQQLLIAAHQQGLIEFGASWCPSGTPKSHL
jgi:DNA-binding NarL/FixJ family response regulator